jgi:hypothetical protein
MTFQIFKKKKKNEMNLMELTPITLYEHELNGDGLINVLVPRFQDRILGKYLQPKMRNKYIKANLDKFGTAAWEMMDGTTKVSELSDGLLEKFGKEIEPVDKRLILFLSNLYHNGFINFKELKKGNSNG